MKKIITAFPPFKKENISEINDILSKAFGNIENTTEIVIIHDCKNPRCPMGTLLGLIGTEEDEMILMDFIESEIKKDEEMDKKLSKSLSVLPESVIKHLSKNN
jgi:hypothetical protein